jgi:ankyrin repeat protein
VEIVRELLKHGATPEKLQGGGIYDNGFNAAICKGHLNVVKLLLDEKLDPNLKTTAGLHPLVAACKSSDETGAHDELVTLLLEHGADANAGADAQLEIYPKPKLQSLSLQKRFLDSTRMFQLPICSFNMVDP